MIRIDVVMNTYIHFICASVITEDEYKRRRKLRPARRARAGHTHHIQGWTANVKMETGGGGGEMRESWSGQQRTEIDSERGGDGGVIHKRRPFTSIQTP